MEDRCRWAYEDRVIETEGVSGATTIVGYLVFTGRSSAVTLRGTGTPKQETVSLFSAVSVTVSMLWYLKFHVFRIPGSRRVLGPSAK